MATARRVSLFHRETRTYLSSAAVEILLGQAQILSEGQVESGTFFGTTMITIDCQQAKQWVSDPCDGATNRQLAELVLNDDLFLEKTRRLGAREARRLAQSPLGEMQIDLSLRTSDSKLHVDINVEAPATENRSAI